MEWVYYRNGLIWVGVSDEGKPLARIKKVRAFKKYILRVFGHVWDDSARRPFPMKSNPARSYDTVAEAKKVGEEIIEKMIESAQGGAA